MRQDISFMSQEDLIGVLSNEKMELSDFQAAVTRLSTGNRDASRGVMPTDAEDASAVAALAKMVVSEGVLNDEERQLAISAILDCDVPDSLPFDGDTYTANQIENRLTTVASLIENGHSDPNFIPEGAEHLTHVGALVALGESAVRKWQMPGSFNFREDCTHRFKTILNNSLNSFFGSADIDDQSLKDAIDHKWRYSLSNNFFRIVSFSMVEQVFKSDNFSQDIKDFMVDKIRGMIDDVTHPDKLDSLSSVAACFFKGERDTVSSLKSLYGDLWILLKSADLQNNNALRKPLAVASSRCLASVPLSGLFSARVNPDDLDLLREIRRDSGMSNDSHMPAVACD